MNERRKSRLGLKFTGVAALALVIAFCVYLLLYEGVVYWMLYTPVLEDHWQRQETEAAESFQAYVTEHEYTVEQAMSDASWERDYGSVYLFLVTEEDENLASVVEDETQPGTAIACADGTVYAYIYASEVLYDSMGRGASLFIAALCFFLILIPYVYRLIHRIARLNRQVEILTGGDLDYQIEVSGRDELAMLGLSMERMRRSVLAQMARENEAVLANSRLITSLSHDLRTPLTKLTGYLEILRYEKYQDKTDARRYLNSAIEKAEQMKCLSDEMFRHFQVNGQGATDTEAEAETVSGPLLLSQLLSELCYDLQAVGFEAQPPDLDGDYFLTVCIGDLRRVFDNLFSNIKKYGDPAYPLQLTASRYPDEVSLTIANHIGRAPSGESQGIGLPTVHTLLAQNGGTLAVQRSGATFRATVRLPITNPSSFPQKPSALPHKTW